MSYSTQRRASAAQFDAVRPYLRISEERMEAARLAMVDGVPVSTVAEKYGWTRQAVSICIRKVWEAMEELNVIKNDESASIEPQVTVLPPGWAQMTFVAPVEILDRWKAELATITTSTHLTEKTNSVQ